MINSYSVGCKVNLNLFINGIREDGYHIIDSLFFPLSEPSDTLIFHKNTHKGIAIQCIGIHINPHKNTIFKAYNLFAEKTGYRPNIKVVLKKGIPCGAGLGGGSADAACVLQFLYKRWNNTEKKNLNEFEFLKEIAVQVGADVPFFLKNTLMQAQGIGEKLNELALPQAFQNTYLVLLCPSVFISTAKTFQAFDLQNQANENLQKFSASESLTSENKQDIYALEREAKHLVVNHLEPVVFDTFPALRKYKEICYKQGAVACAMSGSGSSLFALFRNKQEAEYTKYYFSKTNNMQVYGVFPL